MLEAAAPIIRPPIGSHLRRLNIALLAVIASPFLLLLLLLMRKHNMKIRIGASKSGQPVLVSPQGSLPLLRRRRRAVQRQW